MFVKIILSVITALLCIACSDKKVTSDVDSTEETAKCRENYDPAKCEDIVFVNCHELSAVDPEYCDFDDFESDYVPGGTMSKEELFKEYPNILAESHAEGSVIGFTWQNTLPWYYRSKEHKYGFDKDPMSNWPDYIEAGKDVYVSVAKGEVAKVKLKVPSEYSKISLVNKDGVKMCSGSTCDGDVSLDAGDYKLMDGNNDLDRNLHVIAYEKKGPYEITYVQFDGEDGSSCLGEAGCYERNTLQTKMNEVFSQAVMSVNLKEIKPSEIGLESLLEFDMTDGGDDAIYKTLRDKILLRNPMFKEFNEARFRYDESKNNCEKYKEEGNAAYQDAWCKQYEEDKLIYKKKSEAAVKNPVRAVVGINSFRLIWKLKNQKNSNELSFPKSQEAFYTAYKNLYGNGFGKGAELPVFLKSYSNKCSGGAGEKPVPVVLKFLNGPDPIVVSLLGQSGEPISFSSDCDYLYVDTYAFLPGMKNKAQVTYPYRNDDDELVGAVSIAPRRVGESSLNTLIHEVGHQFDLSDLYIDGGDPSVPYCMEMSEDGKFIYKEERQLIGGQYWMRYLFTKEKCSFITSEANLMNHEVPTGPKLRYRPMPIVETSTNDRIGTFDSQWECLQNANCGRYSE